MRSMYISAGVLLLSLTGAWVQFTAEPDKIGTDEVLIMAGRVESITNIAWTSEKQDVFIDGKFEDICELLEKPGPDLNEHLSE